MLSRKSLYKTITWRLISIVLSFTTSYVFLGSLDLATKYTIVYSIVSSILYYWHEMLYKWLRRQGVI